jgi:hypothetical protein
MDDKDICNLIINNTTDDINKLKQIVLLIDNNFIKKYKSKLFFNNIECLDYMINNYGHYDKSTINYILYNNRTYEGVVKNFMPKLKNDELNILLEIGNQLHFIKKILNKDSSIIIDKSKLDLDLPDIEIYPKHIKYLMVIFFGNRILSKPNNYPGKH